MRRTKSIAGFLCAVCAALIAAGDVRAGGRDDDDTGAVALTLEHEAGPLYVLQNDGRYGAAGTDYDAAAAGQQDTLYVSRRTAIELALGPRHTVILLYAPLLLESRVTLDRDLMFRDTMFAQGTVVDHTYMFDGYRGSYLYGLVRGAVDLDVGATVQIRSAQVAFSSPGAPGAAALHDEENDIGVVFAAKTRLRYQPEGSRPYGEVEADALSTFGLVRDVDGGIYDVAVTLGVPVAEPIDLVLRARLVGGGAEVPAQAIDNWANFLALTAGLRVAVDELW